MSTKPWKSVCSCDNFPLGFVPNLFPNGKSMMTMSAEVHTQCSDYHMPYYRTFRTKFRR